MIRSKVNIPLAGLTYLLAHDEQTDNSKVGGGAFAVRGVCLSVRTCSAKCPPGLTHQQTRSNSTLGPQKLHRLKQMEQKLQAPTIFCQKAAQASQMQTLETNRVLASDIVFGSCSFLMLGPVRPSELLSVLLYVFEPVQFVELRHEKAQNYVFAVPVEHCTNSNSNTAEVTPENAFRVHIFAGLIRVSHQARRQHAGQYQQMEGKHCKLQCFVQGIYKPNENWTSANLQMVLCGAK